MKTVIKPLYALALILPLAATAPAYARGLTVTTDNGGSVSKEHTCIQGNDMVTCESVTTGTNAAGESVSRGVVRTNDGSGTDVETTLIAPDGSSQTRNRGIIVTR